MKSLILSKRFLPYFLAQFFGAFNDNLIKRSVEMLIVYAGLSGSISPALATTLLLGGFILPFFLFSAPAGYLADVIDKRRVIQIIKILEILIVLVAAWGFINHSAFFAASSVIAMGMHSAFFGPVKFSYPAEILREDELIAGNGFIEAGTNIAILIGAICGGVFILGANGPYIISGLAIAAALIGFASSLAIPPRAAETTPKQRLPYLGSIKLFELIYQDTGLFRVVLGISWFWTLGALILTLFPSIVHEMLFAPEVTSTFFLTLFSLGVAIGSFLASKILKGRVEAIPVPLASLGMAGALLVFALCVEYSGGSPSNIPSFSQFLFSISGAAISISLLVMSICGGIFIVPLYGLLQVLSPRETRSQIIGANNIMNALFMVAGSGVLSLLFYLSVSIGTAMILLSVVTVCFAVYTCLLLPGHMLRSILRIIFSYFYRIEISGLENFDAAGKRTLIVANHLSFLDAAVLASYLPAPITFAVNTEISRKWWMAPAMKMMDALPIDPTNPMSAKKLVDRLKEDRKVMIFPEGRITTTGSLMKVYEGPGMIADKARCAILPIRLEGFQYTPFSRIRSQVHTRLFPKLFLTVCPPLTLQVDAEIKGKERRQKLSLLLHDLMISLLFETRPKHATLLEALKHTGKTRGIHNKIIKDPLTQEQSYHDLLLRSFVLSKLLRPFVSRGDYTGVLLPNAVTTVISHLAIHRLSATPALLNYSAGPQPIRDAIKIAQIRTVITSRRFIEMGKLEELESAIKSTGANLIYLEEVSAKLARPRKILYGLQYTLQNFRAAKSDPNSGSEAAFVLFTSGSEGTPKGVVLSHSNILSNCEQVASVIPLRPSEKVFNALPLFHSFGLTGATLMPLLKGIQVILYPSPLHYKVIPELVYGENGTILFGTPTFLAGYARRAHPYDFYSVRYVFSGAERLPDKVRQMWADKFGLRIFEGYGATETSPIISVNTPMHYKPGSVGRFVPGINHRLEEIPGITEGKRLFVSGPNVMKGYLRIERPGEVEAPDGGWYDTGDIVTVNEDGFVIIRGRAKRFAKIGGEMVSLTAIEQSLEKLWPESLVAILATADERKGERIVAVTNKASNQRSDMTEHLKRQGFPELALPRELILMEKIPLLGSGKIDLIKLKNLI